MTTANALDASTARAEALACLVETFEACGIENPKQEASIALCAASGVSPIALIVAPHEPPGRRPRGSGNSRRGGRPASPFRGSSKGVNSGASRSRFRRRFSIPGPKPKRSSRRASGCSRTDARSHCVSSTSASAQARSCAPCSANSLMRAGSASTFRPAPRMWRAAISRLAASPSGPRFGSATGREASRGRLTSSWPIRPIFRGADLPGLPREVREFDPRVALDGGIDGLDAYRRIMPESRPLLSGGGWLAVEIGAGQAARACSQSRNAAALSTLRPTRTSPVSIASWRLERHRSTWDRDPERGAATMASSSDEHAPRGELTVRLIAMPRDTNANGDIFGGWVISQMDQAGGIRAAETLRDASSRSPSTR